MRRSAPASLSSARLEGGVLDLADSAEQRIGEISPKDGADLRDFARFAKPVETRRERLLKRRRDRLQAAGLAALEEKARDFLDEQRHPTGALAHALDHLSAQRMASAELPTISATSARPKGLTRSRCGGSAGSRAGGTPAAPSRR